MNLNFLDLTESILSTIKSTINIVDVISLLDFDSDFESLKKRLSDNKKHHYTNSDYYVIVHVDTDYYLPKCPYGFSIFNLYKTFKEIDVDIRKIIFLTNHSGIRKEFEILSEVMYGSKNITPEIIDNTITPFAHGCASLYSKEYEDKKINIERIEHHGICMMGKPRVHRNAIFNHLKKNHLLDKIKTSYNSDGWANEI